MKILNDEILNKYIDNELNEFEIKELKEIINSDPEAEKKLNAHEMVDTILRKLEVDEAPKWINEFVMNKILKIPKAKKSTKNLFVSIMSLFSVIVVGTLGYLFSQLEFEFAASESGLGAREKIFNFVSEYIPQMPNIIDDSSVLYIGLSLTMLLLISGYFIVESHRNFKRKLNTFTH